MPSEVADDDPDQPVLHGWIPTQTGPRDGVDWEQLLTHRPRLLAVARRCGCPAADAPDVVQEALLKVLLRPPAHPERSLAFLIRTVRNMAIDRHRRGQTEQRVTEGAALHPQPVPGPEEDVCDHAEGAWLHTQTAALRPREREALLARAAGLTTAEIALQMQTTRKTVEHLTARARRALQALTLAGCALLCLSSAAWDDRTEPACCQTSHRLGGTALHVDPLTALPLRT